MKVKKSISLALLLAMLLGLLIPAAFADDKTLHIKTADELIAFANDCNLDTYSKGMTVVLDNDIDLGEEEFYPIPTFSGVFDGQGHSIYNLTTATDGSHQGLFRYVQAEGTVKNLNVKSTVKPGGSRNQLGGIVGLNYGVISDCSFEGIVSGLAHIGGICGENQGSIKNCKSSGSIEGKQASGGICGKNIGIIINCENSAEVNTSISENALNLDELTLIDIANIDLTNAEDPNVVTDCGGICGYSTGLISECKNTGAVGYQHYGYNIGGVVGRQTGYVEKCSNYGKVFGRKDVGGVIGQMEPYLHLKNAVNLAGEVYALHGMVSSALDNFGNMPFQMKDSFENIRNDAGDMLDKIHENKNNSSGVEIKGTAAEKAPLRAVNLSAPSDPPAGGAAPQTDPGANAGNQPSPAAEPDIPTDTVPDLPDNPGGSNPSDPELDPGFGFTENEYRDYLESMADELRFMNTSIGDSAEYMVEDLKRVSAQLSNVILIIANLLGGGDRAVIEDISAKLGKDDIDGRVDSCINYGQVEADKNVGGVAGMMGIEYDFDLEGSLTENFSRSKLLTATYQTKCVSSGNINEGVVIAKKDNVGGICGLENLGSIRNAQGYGSIKSEEGGCVGGIAGYSESDIRDSYAMCNLAGNTNIGGIAGYGTKISGCGSLVGIADLSKACCGTIAGWADVTVKDNINNNSYVHDRLGAIDGISYEGKAVAMDYDSFLKLKGLPERFSTLNLSYVADGKEIKKLEFKYGGSIDESLIPPVPEKEGFTGSWPEYDYSKLYFSDTIEAVYLSRQAAIASEVQREDSPLSIVLLEGDFPDGAKVLLNKYSGEGPETAQGHVYEKWVMRIDEAGEIPKGEYTVRYAMPDTKGSVSIYVYDGENWNNVDNGKNGSYLTFPASGEELVFCSVISEKESPVGLIIGISAAVLVLIILLVIIKCSRKKKKAKAAAAEEKSEEQNAEDESEEAESSGEKPEAEPEEEKTGSEDTPKE